MPILFENFKTRLFSEGGLCYNSFLMSGIGFEIVFLWQSVVLV